MLGRPALADKAHPTIGFTVYDMTSFIAWGKQGAEAITKANNGTLLWQSAHGDVNTQISQIQQFINQKVDVIIIVAAVNSSTLGPQIEQANQGRHPDPRHESQHQRSGSRQAGLLCRPERRRGW